MASRNLEAYRKLQELGEFGSSITSERSRAAMYEAFTEDYIQIEPPSLPHGGVYHGRDAWLEMNAHMRSIWDQKLEVVKIWDLPEDDMLILHTDMEWTARSTGKTVKFPAVELLYFRDAKICKVDLYLQDTKMIMDTLEP